MKTAILMLFIHHDGTDVLIFLQILRKAERVMNVGHEENDVSGRENNSLKPSNIYASGCE